MDVKSTWIPTWHQMDHVFVVTWTIFENHLLKIGLTQDHETMALQTLTTVDLFYFNMCDDPHEWDFIEIAFGCRPVTYDFTLHLKIRDHTTWFWGCVGTTPWTLSFGLSQFHGHSFWLVCESGLAFRFRGTSKLLFLDLIKKRNRKMSTCTGWYYIGTTKDLNLNRVT